MNNNSKEEDDINPSRVLARAKKIANHQSLSKDELFKEYTMLVDEYEALVKGSGKPTGSGSQPPVETDARPDQPEEIVAMKSRLLSHITHEFLTPLNLIITPLEQLLARSRSQEQKKTFALMHRNSQRLLLLISQILELLKLESMKLKLKASKQNLIPFLKGITASFELLADEKDVALIFQTDKENIPLYFEPDKIAEVICNLIMNSLRHTPPGGQIRVSVSQLPGNSVEISLHNTGAEITIDQTTRIFDRFYQLNERFEHFIKSLGIGLFLAREYINLHHGTIQVKSAPGKGTEFVIRLPTGKAHLKSDELEEPSLSTGAKETGSKISQRYAYMVQLEREEKERNQADSSSILPNEKEIQDRDIVLLVEDNTDMRGFIKTLLTEEDFLVVEASNGREGIDRAKEIIPDIIISDIMMPDVDGYRLCRELKQDIKTSHVPIILLSVKYTETEITRGLETGADDYITKPFNMEILLTRVRNLINQRRQLQQRIQWETVIHSSELGLSSLDDNLLKKIQQTIDKNLSDPDFGLEQLADALYMSRASLNRKVKNLTGQSPNKFIQSYRLKRSLDLLKSNVGNVTEVAFQVGFSSSAYFTKCFKEKFKRLPSEFHTL
ncbi:MAG: response regulator [Candidatus Aminicenantes bacterium]|jgi:signal transduction histidine kinase/CheY-like chemotaxis protein/AraC-like DNA-binding protein